MEPIPRRRRFVEGVRERRDRHKERSKLVRVGAALAGVVVVLAGLAMIPLPGPGLLVTAAGFGVLALEFAWAERLLERTVEQMGAASDKVNGASRAQQAILVLLGVLVGLAALTAACAWDIPIIPV
jgi:uncharacterized protein (TIGR02611 family)